MKNTTFKIAILAVAIASMIGAVLFFIQKITEPPTEPSKDNVYLTDIKARTGSYKTDSTNLSESYNELIGLIDRADLFVKDSLITVSDRDESLKKPVNIFAQTFINWANLMFDQSDWHVADHKTMQGYITRLNKLTALSDGTYLVNSDCRTKFSGINQTIADYNRAWQIAHTTRCSSLNDARSIINSRNQYTKGKLVNCTRLQTALQNLPSTLRQSYYRYLSGKVDHMERYRNYLNYPTYKNAVDDVKQLVVEYANSEHEIFGSTTGASDLLSRLESYRKAAYDDCDENGEWYYQW